MDEQRHQKDTTTARSASSVPESTAGGELPRIQLGDMRISVPDDHTRAPAAPAAKREYSANHALLDRLRSTQRPRRDAIANPNAPQQKPDRLGLQLFVSAAIFLCILALRQVDLPIVKDAMDGLSVAVSTDTDMDKALGKLKFVGNWVSTAREVFNPAQQSLMLPVQDATVTDWGKAEPHILSMNATEGSAVLCAADGKVFFSGDSEQYGTLVRVQHSDGYETCYAGVLPEVKAGATVLRGQRIASAQAGQPVLFLLLKDGKAIDPSAYFGNTQ